MGMAILPPDINRSSLKFVPEATERGNGIRYGLAAIKNIGEASMVAAIEEREKAAPFKSLDDYCGRLDSRSVNRKSLESLIRAGAFDFTGQDRAQLFAQIDQALAAGAALQRDRMTGQVSLFGDLELAPVVKRNGRTIEFAPWSLSEKLAYEKELLGFYVTGHPLDAYRDLLEGGKYTAISDLGNREDKEQVKVAGSISSFEKKFTRKDGKPFAVMALEDFTGTIEVLVWADIFARFGKELEAGKIVAVSAKLERRDETVRLIASEIGAVAQGKKAGALTIDISLARTSEEKLLALRELVMKYPGPQPLFLRFRGPEGQELRVKTNTGYSVRDDESFRAELAQLLD
jgi:DNA polymerase III subunit alpha